MSEWRALSPTARNVSATTRAAGQGKRSAVPCVCSAMRCESRVGGRASERASEWKLDGVAGRPRGPEAD